MSDLWYWGIMILLFLEVIALFVLVYKSSRNKLTKKSAYYSYTILFAVPVIYFITISWLKSRLATEKFIEMSDLWYWTIIALLFFEIGILLIMIYKISRDKLTEKTIFYTSSMLPGVPIIYFIIISWLRAQLK